jgi:16S rRNA (cytidine1402-2'-O)-methyltransferase
VGRLVVVPTPIGNLEDMTLRGIRELREASLILAEDTRHTRKLLSHYEIRTPLLSYHQHNTRSRRDQALRALAGGDVALVSDAGMPGLSDPGGELIRAAVERGFEVDVLPGPSAAPAAAVLGAFDAPGFLFAGFLPRLQRDRAERLHRLADVDYPIVLYEAPHRVRRTLQDLLKHLGDRPAVAVRELTKVHQEVVRGRVRDLVERFDSEEPRGEISLVIGPRDEARRDLIPQARIHMANLREKGEDRQVAIEQLIHEFGVSRNDAYRMWVEAGRPNEQG